MQVAIQVDPTQLQGDIHAVFDSLTLEQRTDVAKDILRSWLDMPYGAEREYREARAAAIFEKRYPHTAFTKDDWRYRDILKEIPAPREQIVVAITDAMIEQAKAEITKLVAEDPQVQAHVKAAGEFIRENYPKFVHDATVAAMTVQMKAVTDVIQQTLVQLPTMANSIQELNNRLLNRGM